MDSNKDKMNDINEVEESDVNTIAQYTGSRANAVRNFIATNNLDPAKLAIDLSKDQKAERNNFAAAISGRAKSEYLLKLKTKYTLNENKEPDKPKRFKITLAQLESLIPRIIINKRSKNDIQNADK
jgi:hypothetical protein